MDRLLGPHEHGFLPAGLRAGGGLLLQRRRYQRGLPNSQRQRLFVAETHITYERELRAGAGLRFESQILDASDKAIDCMHFMYAADEGYLAAVNQIPYFHVDLERRRAAPFPDDAQARIDAWREAHASLPRPPQAGRSIGLRKNYGG